MEFAISTIDYFTSKGFDTTKWRKSSDGTKALVHLEYAMTLIPNARNDNNILIAESPSQGFTNLLNSAEWAS
jgi:hypothetical protein